MLSPVACETPTLFGLVGSVPRVPLSLEPVSWIALGTAFSTPTGSFSWAVSGTGKMSAQG